MRIVPPRPADGLTRLTYRFTCDGTGIDQYGIVQPGLFGLRRLAGELGQVLGHRGPLLAVAVTDVTPQGLSAVYTFFDPDQAHRGLGTFAILQQIAWAQREQLPHLYLGYWIRDHRKMDYKRRFRPLEAYDGRRWHAFDDELDGR